MDKEQAYEVEEPQIQNGEMVDRNLENSKNMTKPNKLQMKGTTSFPNVSKKYAGFRWRTRRKLKKLETKIENYKESNAGNLTDIDKRRFEEKLKNLETRHNIILIDEEKYQNHRIYSFSAKPIKVLKMVSKKIKSFGSWISKKLRLKKEDTPVIDVDNFNSNEIAEEIKKGESESNLNQDVINNNVIDIPEQVNQAPLDDISSSVYRMKAGDIIQDDLSIPTNNISDIKEPELSLPAEKQPAQLIQVQESKSNDQILDEILGTNEINLNENQNNSVIETPIASSSPLEEINISEKNLSNAQKADVVVATERNNSEVNDSMIEQPNSTFKSDLTINLSELDKITKNYQSEMQQHDELNTMVSHEEQEKDSIKQQRDQVYDELGQTLIELNENLTNIRQENEVLTNKLNNITTEKQAYYSDIEGAKNYLLNIKGLLESKSNNNSSTMSSKDKFNESDLNGMINSYESKSGVELEPTIGKGK